MLSLNIDKINDYIKNSYMNNYKETTVTYVRKHVYYIANII